MSGAARSAALVLLAVAAMLAFAPRAAFAQLDDSDEDDERQTLDPRAETSAEAEPQAPAEAQSEAPFEAPSEAPSEAQDAPPSAPQPESASAAAGVAPQRALGFYAGAGLGLGTLEFARPTSAGVQKLPETAFAGVELLLRGRAWPRERFSLEVQVAYQSSLGLVLQTDPLFGLPQNVAARSQDVELSAAPIVRLGQSANAVALAFPLGLVVRSLFPAVHQFSVPKYSYGGPQLRADLLLKLGEFVSLQLGPAATWLVLVSSTLTREGACCQGFALGGRGSIEARVGPAIRVALAYEESHAFVPAGSWRFMDVQRFLTARIAGAL